MSQRTIKFRCWDDNNKEMLYDDEDERLDESNPDACCEELYGAPWSNFRRALESLQHEVSWHGKRHTGLVLLQFTGLHDKNGKEIYEGDVVEVANKNLAGFGNRSIVTWFESNAAFGTRSKKGNGYLTKIAIEDGEWKVIGSIYENPELLK